MGCESEAYYAVYNHGAKLVLSFFFLSVPLCLSMYLEISLFPLLSVS